jgi:hypothetical protein
MWFLSLTTRSWAAHTRLFRLNTSKMGRCAPLPPPIIENYDIRARDLTRDPNDVIVTLQRKSHLHVCILRRGIARPQSQFPHSSICERFIYSIHRIGPHIFLQQKSQIDPGNIYKSLTDTWHKQRFLLRFPSASRGTRDWWEHLNVASKEESVWGEVWKFILSSGVIFQKRHFSSVSQLGCAAHF